MKELIDAAKAVITRWETPLWKDVPATAEYIYRLRDAVERAEKPPADFEKWFRGRLMPTYCETWQSAQQAERERIKQILTNYRDLFDGGGFSMIMERIDATE